MSAPRLSAIFARRGRALPETIIDAPVEWVIAQARLYLCALSLMALSIDPPQPVEFARIVNIILGSYFAFAIGVVIATNWRLPDARSRVGIHVADVLVTSLLLLLVQEPEAPFFVFFIFVLLAATLRWNWPGVFVTLAVLLLVVLVTHVAPKVVLSVAPPEPGNEIYRIIIRGAHLVVVGTMLAYVGAYLERSRQRLAHLATWPAYSSSESKLPAFASTLAHAAVVLTAPRVLAVWQEADEPFLKIAIWNNRSYQELAEYAGSVDDVVAPALAQTVFAAVHVSSALALLRTGHHRIAGPLVDAEFAKRFDITSLASAPFTAAVCRGRVFILDRNLWNEAHLLLTEIVASRVGVELDRQTLQTQAQDAAAIRERVRLAHDVHDGVLQSLTAARLQLKLMKDESDEKAGSRFNLVTQLLSDEQRRLRQFVDSARLLPVSSERAVPDEDLHRAVTDAARNWNCALSLIVAPNDTTIPKALKSELSLMISEGIANAVRHGHATQVWVAIQACGDELRVAVKDNGKGFDGLAGERPHSQRSTVEVGPASLRRRVEQLRGSLEVLSTPAGAELRIGLPIT